MIRLILFIGFTTWASYSGGWGGFFFMLCVFSVLGIAIPPKPRSPEDVQDDQNEIYDEVVPARRGSEVDPTRPDDFKGMKEYRKRA